jgi:hypothetical protein
MWTRWSRSRGNSTPARRFCGQPTRRSRRANWFRDHDPVLLSQAGAHIALDVLELAEPPLAPSANGETEAEAFEGCFVNPITRYGEAEALTTELVFIGQQMPETEIRGWLDNCRR